MTIPKLGIIGGSGLYEIEGLEKPKWKNLGRTANPDLGWPCKHPTQLSYVGVGCPSRRT